MATVWLIIAVLAIAVELVATHFVLFFVAISAILTSLLAVLSVPLLIQVIVFAVVSVFLPLLFRRRLLRRFVAGPALPSRAEALLGSHAIVTEAITGELGAGRVLANGEDWKATCDTPIEPGSKCIVVGWKGIELMVEPVNPEEGGLS